MKRIFTSFFILCFLATINAQHNYNTNEWIDYEKTYYKIKVAENGIYQIDFETLKVNNLLPNTILGKQLCLFNQGKEIPLYISNADQWKAGDYLQFYGEKLDGKFDQRLYKNPNHQLHTCWSQFTDTAVYFLTVKNPSSNIIEINNDLNKLSEKETYFMHESVYLDNRQVSLGIPDFHLSTLPIPNSNFESWKFYSHNASYGEGEGWVGNTYLSNSTTIENFVELDIPTPYVFDNGMKANIQFKVVGGSDDKEIVNDHLLKAYVNNQLVFEDQFEGYGVKSGEVDVAINEIGELTQVKFEAANKDAKSDRQSYAYVKIKYPRKYDFNAIDHFAFKIDNKAAGNYLVFENLLANESYYLYDLTHLIKLKLSYNEAQQIHEVYLPVKAGDAQRKLILQKENSIKNVAGLTKISFTNYGLLANQGDYIIITHPTLSTTKLGVLQYENYRKSEAGGAHQVIVVNVEELYDQYSYGIRKHPLAIKYFLNDASSNWSILPKHCFLLGKGIRNNRARLQPENWANNLVPTFGESPSDQYFGSPNFDPLSNIAIGRFSATNETDILNYLHKVKQVEQKTTEDCNYINEGKWQHNILNIAGGSDISQASIFSERLANQANIAKNGTPIANSLFLSKFNEIESDTNVCTINAPPYNCFHEIFSNGVKIINFLGHANALEWEVETGSPTDYNYKNHYPIMISQSSFTGDSHKSYANAKLTMPEDWMNAKQAGATAFLGFGTLFEMRFGADFIDEVYQQMFEEKPEATLGEQINAAIHQHYDTDNMEAMHTVNQFIFSGDPALRYAVNIKPELAITETQVTTNIKQIDDAFYNIEVSFNFDRLNIPADEAVPYTIILQGEKKEIVGEGFLKDGETANFIGEFPLPHSEGQNFIIQLDADNKYEEICEENNSFIIAVDEFLIDGVSDFVDASFQIQNHPNPFSEQTVFTITLPKVTEQEVLHLSISNLNGQIINEIPLKQSNAQQQIIWDATNKNGKQLPAGVYCYQLKSEGNIAVSLPKKLVLIK